MAKRKLAGVLFVGLTLLPGAAAAQSGQTGAMIEALQAQIQSMQQQLETLKQQVDQQKQQTAEQTKAMAEVKKAQADDGRVSFPGGRPTISSADGRFSAGITGRIHFDTAFYLQDKTRATVPAAVDDLNDGTNFRRARLGIVGRAFKDFEYTLVYDFGGSPDNTGSIDEAKLSYLGIPNVALEIGAFKPSLTLEDSISSNDISFLERSSAVNIATSLAAGTARNAVGARWWGDRHFIGGYLTGGVTGVEADDEQRSGTFRGVYLPWRDETTLVHLGASGSYVFEPNQTNGAADGIQLRDRPELRVDSNRLIDTGAIDADSAYSYGGELALQHRNFSLQGEYLRFGIERKANLSDVEFAGWYVMGSWVLTGESRSYSNSRGAFGTVRPAKPFNMADGTFGAFELVARYSSVDLNDANILGGEQDIVTAGLNWYLNGNFRLMFNYQYVDVDRRNAGGAQIGQDYHAVSMRAQANW